MKKQLLLIEDAETMQRFLLSFLKKEYEILIAASLKDARDLLVANIHFDAILLDLNLPDGNGVEMMHWLKRGSELCKIPVVVISGVKDQDVRWQVLEDGAADFISKPFLPKELKVRLNKILSNQLVEQKRVMSRKQFLFEIRNSFSNVLEMPARSVA